MASVSRRTFILLLSLLVPAVDRAQTPVGAEFAVNVTTTQAPFRDDVSIDPHGGFVVVWGWGGGLGVVGRRFSTDAVPQGGEFQVNLSTAGYQGDPELAVSANGEVVVVWRSDPPPYSISDVSGRRFSASGTPMGGEFTVNTYTTAGQSGPTITTGANGGFVVAWHSYGQSGSSLDVYGQRFDSTGGAVGTEFAVNANTDSNQAAPAISADAAGNFVVVWHSSAMGYADVVGRRFDAAGTALGDDFQVNTYTTNNQNLPAVAASANGSFVVVWESRYQDGDGWGIFGQRYDKSGVAAGAEFRINTHTMGDQKKPVVASDGGSTFLVAWVDYDGSDGSGFGIRGRWYEGSGASLGGEFQVNTYTTGYQYAPVVSANARGDFIAVWQGEGEHDNNGTLGRRFRSWLFVDDFESGDTSAWSAQVP